VDKEIDTGGLRESLRTLKDPEVVIYLLFMVIPLFACTVFMTYTVPLEIDDFGYSSTVISTILLGSYMIAAYAGPVMTRLITNFLRPISGTFVYCLGVAALIALYETGRSFGLIVLVALLLGLMDTFGPSVMIGAYTGIADKSGHTGGGSLLIYILVTRIGMSIAPTLILIFGTPLALSAGVVIGNVVFFYFRRLMNANSKKV
jgi:predicted MFS family arabinose efflux permease